MKNKYFDIIVKNLLKHKNKLIEIEKIKTIWKKVLDSEYSEKKLYKIIYYLKNREYLQSLKKDILIVKDPEKKYTNQQLLETYYRNILKKHCNEFVDWKRYIWWIKALELNNSSYEIPEEIIIVNSKKQCTETVMFDKQILFKLYSSDEKKLFSTFYKMTRKIYIKNNVFPIACTELAILESLYNPSIISKWYADEFIKKILRKSWNSLDTKIWEQIVKTSKHHSSINRLYKLSQSVNPEIAEKIKNIIKRYSYFIW